MDYLLCKKNITIKEKQDEYFPMTIRHIQKILCSKDGASDAQ